MNLFPVWKVREVIDKATNVVMNYSEVEARVRQATNDDAWGPAGSLMQELSRDTFMYECFPEVMGMLWKRMLHEGRKNWRRIYKALLLLSYLIRNGSERVVTSAREHLYDLKSLQDYSCYDENGKDQGMNVRNKVKDIISLVQDSDRLREERKKAKKSRDKYVGMSSDDCKFNSGRGFSSGNGNWKSSGGGYKDYDDYDDYSTKKDNTSDDSFEKSKPKAEDSNEFGESKLKKVVRNTVGAKSEIKVSKKVDLGAAAHYKGDNTSTAATPQKTSDAPAQPSGGQVDLLNDLFDAPAPAQQTSTATNNNQDLFGDVPSATNNDDDFADFDQIQTATSAAPTQQPVDDLADFGQLTSSTPSVTQQPEPATFDPFASLSSPQQPQSTPQQPQSNADLFGGMMTSQPSNLMTSQMNMTSPQQNNFMGMMSQPQSNSNLMSMMSQQPSMTSQQPNLMMMHQNSAPAAQNNVMQFTSKAPATVATSKQQLGSTWSGISGVNIDLDGLGKPQMKEKRPTMNQLQRGNQPVQQQNINQMMGSMNINQQNPNMMMSQMGNFGMMGQSQNQQQQFNNMNQQQQFNNMNQQQQFSGMFQQQQSNNSNSFNF